jgi:glycine/D-amino acid oxidase-like deaminating enzyme
MKTTARVVIIGGGVVGCSVLYHLTKKGWSDVMLLDGGADVGARNERRLALLYAGATAGLEVVHGLVDRVMQLLEIPVRPYAWEAGAAVARARAHPRAPHARPR